MKHVVRLVDGVVGLIVVSLLGKPMHCMIVAVYGMLRVMEPFPVVSAR